MSELLCKGSRLAFEARPGFLAATYRFDPYEAGALCDGTAALGTLRIASDSTRSAQGASGGDRWVLQPRSGPQLPPVTLCIGIDGQNAVKGDTCKTRAARLARFHCLRLQAVELSIDDPGNANFGDCRAAASVAYTLRTCT